MARLLSATLCVDRTRQVVLRDEIEGTLSGQPQGPLHLKETTTFALIGRDPRINPSGSTRPELIFRRDPEYTAEARAAKFQGTATLAILIGADGVPREPRLERTLGYGLDAKAI